MNTIPAETRAGKTWTNLSHAALPKDSVGGTWLKRQADDREKAQKIVEETARAWLGGDFSHLPDLFFEMFADRVVTALDQRL
jgi:hypothetical protein